MKQKLILFTLMALCYSFISGMPLDTRRQIKMKVRQKIEHRSTIHPVPIQVFISNSLLEIEFEDPVEDATITITNYETGKTIYHESVTSSEKSKFIDLLGEDNNTEYALKISSHSWSSTGFFTIIQVDLK